ncbi:MAG: serine/threonine-protein kinase [Planctomycetota bacterium]|nr:serine/threonine-protein kinase [Planctomycetota bacterium]
MKHEFDPLSEALRIHAQHRASRDCSDSELLTRHPQLRELLEPLLAQVSAGASRLKAGVELGDFRLIEPIGRGGMGEVWEAEQLSLRRRVALKVLRAEHFASAHTLERFRREALAGARLRHPNIVAVHSIGEADGIAFIAQELVATRRTLDDVLRELRGATQLPAEHWRRTAELFAQLADALQQAHELGVLHRDLKPSNILIAHDGTPKVADFGIASVEGELELSRTGELAGSPFYMSPEQASARRRAVDARSDVFSLGATLYEALTLVRAFDGDTLTQVLEKILVVDPPDPRALRSMCPRELSVICLKMLEKEPRRRYASMAEVAQELRRFLANEPILARPAGPVTRSVKWCRRHPVLAASAAILLASSGLLAWQRDTAVQAQARAQRKVSELEQVNAFLFDVFSAADQAKARGQEPTARDLLERGAQRLETSLLEQPLVRAGLFDSIGRTFLSLGDDKRAQELLERGLALRIESGGERSLEVADSLSVLAALDARLSRPTALARAQEALALRLEFEPQPSEAGVSAFLALAQAQLTAKAPDDAVLTLEKAVQYVERMTIESRPSRAIVLATQAGVYNRLGRAEPALATADEALRVRREFQAGPHPLVVSALTERASALSRLGQFEAARTTFTELLELERELGGERSERFAALLTQSAKAAREAGDLDAEREQLERALALFVEVASPTHRNALACRDNLLLHHVRTARHREALELAEDTLAVLARAQSSGTSAELSAQWCATFAEDALGSRETAIVRAQLAVESFSKSADSGSQNRVHYLRCALVVWLAREGDLEAAARVFAQTDPANEKLDVTLSRGQWAVLARSELAAARGELGPELALLEALAARETGSSLAWWVPSLARVTLAEALAKTEPERSRQLARRAADELTARFGATHPDTQRALALAEPSAK